MATVKPLDTKHLFRACNAKQFPFDTTADLLPIDVVIAQERALDAVQFGIRVHGDGYNVFALGPAGQGKHAAVSHMLAQEAASRPTPGDWCYVNNFQQSHKPRVLSLPAGRGAGLQGDMDQLIEDLGSAIPTAFESESYRSRVEELEEELKQRQQNALEGLKEQAGKRRITLMRTPTGFAFAPLGDDDEVLRPEQFEQLSAEAKQQIERGVEELQERLQKLLRQFPPWGKETREKIKALNREVAELAVSHLIDALNQRYRDLPNVIGHLEAVRRDIIDHVDEFRGQQEAPVTIPGLMPPSSRYQRYRVNVLVDNGDQRAAPVVYEDLPSHHNLIGRAEYQAQMGALITDFTLIKAGALHRANGGYLILDARQLLLQPFAWDSLKRALRSREIRIESLERMLSLVSTASLEPEPIPLDVKVVLTGERLLYYLLYQLDPDFADLFKVAADFEDIVERSSDTDMLYARLFATLARDAELRPLHRDAVARAIEHSARVAGDAEKLSTHLRGIADLLREADYWAGVAERDHIARNDIQRAVDEQIRRPDRIRTRIYEEIERGTILIDTHGEKTGQINGLSVLQLGDFAFGQPSRITATARFGEGKVIDIERETELGGAIHSKGVLILSSFLASRFGRDQPLSMAASLVFEQSYGRVEGDSASLAELCALLSVLSDLPIRQSLAITGSVNQHGEAQAIGGVNQKIEGFFDVCAARGLTGEQGVLIPAGNVKHLMLRHDVVDAAEAGRFHVYAVANVDQAVTLMTDVEAGAPDDRGCYPQESVNGRAARRLKDLFELRRKFLADAGKKA
jgi:lon-related putative ATP-dependent protease